MLLAAEAAQQHQILAVIIDEKFHSKCKIIVYNSKCSIIETLQRIQLFFSFIHKCNNEFLVISVFLYPIEYFHTNLFSNIEYLCIFRAVNMGLAWIPLKGHVSHKWTVMFNMCGHRLGPMLGEVPASSLCLDTALLPAPNSKCRDGVVIHVITCWFAFLSCTCWDMKL